MIRTILRERLGALGASDGEGGRALARALLCRHKFLAGAPEEELEVYLDDGYAPTEEELELLYELYRAKFPSEPQSVGKGIDRSISNGDSDGDYRFDQPYTDKRTFMKNVNGEERPRPELIRHMAVAFGLGVGTCNELLQTCGYLPLHAKNLHDVAIYSVLATNPEPFGELGDESDEPEVENSSSESESDASSESESESETAASFGEVRRRYLAACASIGDGEPLQAKTPSVNTSYLSRNELVLVKSGESFDSYIRRYRSELNWRHNALLAEHEELVRVFADLFDTRRRGADWDDEFALVSVSEYSFFSFVDRFCRDEGESFHKRFRDQLVNFIAKDKSGTGTNRHPSREVMIILWLFKYIFLNSPGIVCPASYVGGFRTPGMKKSELPDCFERIDDTDRYCFDIHRALYGTSRSLESDGVLFRGQDARRLINDSLDRFGFRVLSRDSRFDAVIQLLCTLKLTRLRSGEYRVSLASLRDLPLSELDELDGVVLASREAGIPLSLAVIFRLLTLIGEALPKNADGSSRRVLECALYSRL